MSVSQTVRPTLVLPPRFTEDTDRVRKAALDADWSIERLFGWRVPEHLTEAAGDLVLYGEPLFAAVVAGRLGLSLLEPTFDWLTTLPQPFLRRDVQFMTLSEARGIATRTFIKPADDKCFPARVYESGAELPADETLPPTTPVLTSTPVRWRTEFRAFALDRQATALSIYARDGELAQDAGGRYLASDSELAAATDFLSELLNDASVTVPPAVVIDVGLIEGAGWAVIEANPAWGSGVYGCNASDVLPVLQRCCLPSERVTDDDAHWILSRTGE